jgi:15-cis-phytoene synthase
MTTPAQYCRQIVRRSGSNFALAFRSLNKPQVRGMHAIYAFCRVVDDIVDGDLALDDKKYHLAYWREQIGALDRETFDDPLAHELAWAVQHFGVSATYLRELIDGVAADLHPKTYPNFSSLLEYCYGVAGTVGLMCLPIFGVQETPDTREAALSLAYAFQLTNILRDLHSDAKAGRVYLPQDDLHYFGIDRKQLVSPLSDEAKVQLQQLIVYEAHRAEEYYTEAWRRFAPHDQQMKPAAIMSAGYHTILQKIERRPSDVLCGRVSLSPWEKLSLVCQAWIR